MRNTDKSYQATLVVLFYFVIYNIIFFDIFPIIFCFFLFRLYKKKDTIASFSDKFCIKFFYKIFLPSKHYEVWFHAASVGELRSLDFLIKKNIREKKRILITTTTIKSAEIAQKYDARYVNYNFLPLDLLLFQILFFLKNRTKKIIIADSEIWINFFTVARIFNVRIILFNARISRSSQARWQIFPQLLKFILQSVDIIMPQSISERDFFAKFHHNIRYFGNLKMLNLNTDKNFTLNEIISDFSHNIDENGEKRLKKILCVISTHEGEDESIITTISNFQNQFDIIYSPRHQHRCQNISNILHKSGISNALFSNMTDKNDVNNGKKCLIIDSIGMLDHIFSVSEIAIFGGAFLPHLKGHNIMEPAAFACKIITGNYVETFDEIVREMLKKNAILQCDLENLANAINNAAANGEMGQNAKEYIAQSMTNMQQVLDFIENC